MPDPASWGRLPDDEAPATGERFVEITRIGDVVVEHITSSATPDAREQRQDHDEWAVVLHGSAELEIEGVVSVLGPGGWIAIPAGTAHRVLRAARGTRWLVLHASAEPGR